MRARVDPGVVFRVTEVELLVEDLPRALINGPGQSNVTDDRLNFHLVRNQSPGTLPGTLPRQHHALPEAGHCLLPSQAVKSVAGLR